MTAPRPRPRTGSYAAVMSSDEAADGAPAAVQSVVRAHVDDLLDRAAAAGHRLEPRPVVEVLPGRGHSSSRPATSREAAAVLVGRDLLDAPPAVQRWGLAHEVAHLLPSPATARGHLGPWLGTVAAVATLVAAAAAVASAVALATAPGVAPMPPWLPLVSVAGVVVLWLVLQRMRRQLETAVDVATAAVFGLVLPPEGVQWLTTAEGTVSRRLPVLLRTHPRPAARRRTGLDTLG